MKILNKINREIEERGISQQDLADLTGIHQSQLSNYLSGKVQMPIAKLELVLDKLGLDPFGENQEETLRLACITAILEIHPNDLSLARNYLKQLATKNVDLLAKRK